MNTTETTVLVASATAAAAGAVASVFATITARKIAKQTPKTILVHDNSLTIHDEVMLVINKLDVVDQLAALQAYKRGDFWFDNFIRDLNNK